MPRGKIVSLRQWVNAQRGLRLIVRISGSNAPYEIRQNINEPVFGFMAGQIYAAANNGWDIDIRPSKQAEAGEHYISDVTVYPG